MSVFSFWNSGDTVEINLLPDLDALSWLQAQQAERNCISNVRPEGQDYPEAARRAAWLLRAARAAERTGVALKDESAPVLRLEHDDAQDFTLT